MKDCQKYTGDNVKYQLRELDIESVELDLENPRIAYALQTYGDNINAEGIALALSNSSDSDSSGTTVKTLEDSIKANGGISNPIVVNHHDGKYTVIEGNTRVQIYKDFKKKGVTGEWGTIVALVYEEMNLDTITSVRLQAHMVGARPWDAYSKAKYLRKLSDEENISIERIIDICGGKRQEIRALIQAYNDMELYYHQKVDDQQFNVKEFSAFRELNESKKRIDALQAHGFTKEDFGEWIIDGKIGRAENVRRLPEVLNNPDTKKIFLDKGLKVAIESLNIPKANELDLPLKVIADMLSKKIATLPFEKYIALQRGEDSETMDSLTYLKGNLDILLENASGNQ